LDASNIVSGGDRNWKANSIIEIDEKIIFSENRFGLRALDFNGNILWESQGINYLIAWNGYGQVKKSSDGNIFHFGTQHCCGAYGRGNLAKVDSSNGTVLWEFNIDTLNFSLKHYQFFIRDIIETTNGDIICLLASNYNSGVNNTYHGLIKLNSDGTKLLP